MLRTLTINKKQVRQPQVIALIVGQATLIITAFMPGLGDTERFWLDWAGQWMLLHHQILTTLGPLTPYPNNPWIDQQWLYALITATAVNYHVYWLIALIHGTIRAALLYCCYREAARARMDSAATILLIGSAASVLVMTDYLRATSLADVFFAAVVLLWRSKYGFSIPVLIALWSNIHASFPLAIGWMFLQSKSRSAVIISTIGLVATLLNPFTWHLWIYAFSMESSALRNFIIEWQPVWRGWFYVVPLIITTLSCALHLSQTIALRKKRLLNLITGSIILVAGITTQRHLPLALIFGIPWICSAFRTIPIKLTRENILGCSIVACALALLPAMGNLTMHQFQFEPRFQVFETRFNSISEITIEELRNHNICTDTFTVANILLDANIRINIDGRMDAYPVRALERAIGLKPDPIRPFPDIDKCDTAILAGTTWNQQIWKLYRMDRGLHYYARKKNQVLNGLL